VATRRAGRSLDAAGGPDHQPDRLGEGPGVVTHRQGGETAPNEPFERGTVDVTDHHEEEPRPHHPLAVEGDELLARETAHGGRGPHRGEPVRMAGEGDAVGEGLQERIGIVGDLREPRDALVAHEGDVGLAERGAEQAVGVDAPRGRELRARGAQRVHGVVLVRNDPDGAPGARHRAPERVPREPRRAALGDLEEHRLDPGGGGGDEAHPAQQIEVHDDKTGGGAAMDDPHAIDVEADGAGVDGLRGEWKRRDDEQKEQAARAHRSSSAAVRPIAARAPVGSITPVTRGFPRMYFRAYACSCAGVCRAISSMYRKW